MHLQTIRVENPQAHNLVVGQSHLTETLDDIHAALTGSLPEIRFGLAFNSPSTSGKMTSTGTDESLIDLAKKSAESIGANQTFVLLLDNEQQPVQIMQVLKDVTTIRSIYCATNGHAEFIVTENSRGRDVMGLAGSYSASDEAQIQVVR